MAADRQRQTLMQRCYMMAQAWGVGCLRKGDAIEGRAGARAVLGIPVSPSLDPATVLGTS